MARELSDVLHYFLDEEEPSSAAGCPVIGMPAHPDDELRGAIQEALTTELQQLGREAHGIRPGWSDLAASELPPEPGAPSYTIEGAAPPPLGDQVRRAQERLATTKTAVVLVPLPTDRPWEPEEAFLLDRCWLTSRPSDVGRAEFFELAERILSLRPQASVGITILGVDGIEEARSAFDALSEIFTARFDRTLRSYGLLLDAQDLLGGRLTSGRAATTLRDVAQLLCDDLAPTHPTTPTPPAPERNPRGEARFQ